MWCINACRFSEWAGRQTIIMAARNLHRLKYRAPSDAWVAIDGTFRLSFFKVYWRNGSTGSVSVEVIDIKIPLNCRYLICGATRQCKGLPLLYCRASCCCVARSGYHFLNCSIAVHSFVFRNHGGSKIEDCWGNTLLVLICVSIACLFRAGSFYILQAFN